MANFHPLIPLIEAAIAASGGNPEAWHECWHGGWGPGGESLYAVFHDTLVDRRLGDMVAAANRAGSLSVRALEQIHAIVEQGNLSPGADHWLELLAAVVRSRRAWVKLAALAAPRDSAQLWQSGRKCLAAAIPQFSVGIWECAAAQCTARSREEAERRDAVLELVRAAAEWAGTHELPAPVLSGNTLDETLERWRTSVLDPAANCAFWAGQRLFLERFRPQFTRVQRSRATLLLRAADPPRAPTIAELKFLIETQRGVIASLLEGCPSRPRED